MHRLEKKRKRSAGPDLDLTVKDWRQQYFKNSQKLEKERHDAEIKRVKLQSYNLVLKNMNLERKLALDEATIQNIRLSVAPELIEYPTFFTEFINQSDKDNISE